MLKIEKCALAGAIKLIYKKSTNNDYAEYPGNAKNAKPINVKHKISHRDADTK